MELKMCPSCGSKEVDVSGNKIHCRECDITFEISSQGAKVQDLDPLGKDRERIAKLESEVEELKRGKIQPGKQTDEVEQDDDNEGFLKVSKDDDDADGDGTADE